MRGFLGGRIDLLPHQLSIAGDVASRHAPRVLLADEVGLGKTIEASLVLHRQLLGGRVGRALILVPVSLVHQWFVELVRRFHLWFKLFDEERCAAIRAADPEANPFLEEQLVLASEGLLLGEPQNARARGVEIDHRSGIDHRAIHGKRVDAGLVLRWRPETCLPCSPPSGPMARPHSPCVRRGSHVRSWWASGAWSRSSVTRPGSSARFPSQLGDFFGEQDLHQRLIRNVAVLRQDPQLLQQTSREP